jgi:small-conductance mechanosensitive channel
MNENIITWLKGPTAFKLYYLVIAFILVLIASFYIKKAISKKVEDTDRKYHARKATNIFGYVLLTLIALIIYRDSIGNLGVAFGLAGAGVAFALQEVITSIAGWISIMFTNQVKVGQRVKIGNVKGDIINIDILKTTVMEVGDWIDGDLYNGKITTISNSFVFKNPIENYSADYPFLWDEIQVPLRLESDYRLARELFTNLINEVCGTFAEDSARTWEVMKYKYRIESAQVAPMITLKFNENWITFNLRYVVDYRKRRSTKDILYTRLLDEISKHDKLITIATSTIEVTNVYENKNEDE